MQIEGEGKRDFKPIVITLEDRTELNALLRILSCAVRRVLFQDIEIELAYGYLEIMCQLEKELLEFI